MKIIFYDTKDSEFEFLNKNGKENFDFYCEWYPLTPSSEVKSEYIDAQGISVFVSSILDFETLKKFPKLKYIFLRSTGYSNVDLEYCKRNNIYVFNVPDYGSSTVAEYIFALILSISRKIIEAKKEVIEGTIDHNNLIGVELNNKTLGIIGFGAIGKKTAQIAKGFNMNVLVYDINKNTEYKNVELDELLEKSDFVSISCPLTEKTKGMINSNNLNKMKKSAYLINTARGEIINTEDLYDSLIEEKIKGAALDVVECEEVLCDSYETCGKKPFLKDICLKKYLFLQKTLKLQNVLITPHTAYNSREANKRIIETTLENINSTFNINSDTKNLVLI